MKTSFLASNLAFWISVLLKFNFHLGSSLPWFSTCYKCNLSRLLDLILTFLCFSYDQLCFVCFKAGFENHFFRLAPNERITNVLNLSISLLVLYMIKNATPNYEVVLGWLLQKPMHILSKVLKTGKLCCK